MSQPASPTRRVIGPIPPRDPKTKRLKLEPQLGERVKLNAIGQPVLDKDGQPIVEIVDTRDPREYLSWEYGQKPAEGSTEGLRLFECTIKHEDKVAADGKENVSEPFVHLYARDADDAARVYKSEMGVIALPYSVTVEVRPLM